MNKQIFKSKYIDIHETLRTEEDGYFTIKSLMLTLKEARKLNKIWKEVKEEVLKSNEAVKDIKLPRIQEYYYDEDEGYWLDEIPGCYSWWELKKQGYIKKFKIFDLEIKDGYELLFDTLEG